MFASCRNWLAAVLGVSAAVSLGWVFAQQGGKAKDVSPETLLPAKSILFFTAQGSAQHAKAWEQTAAHDALVKSGLKDAFVKVLDAFQEHYVEPNGVGEQFNLALSAFQHLQAHGLSLALTVEPPMDGPPKGYAILVLHNAVEFADTLSGLIMAASDGELDFQPSNVEGRKVTSAVIPNSPGVEIGWWTEGSHLVLVAGIDSVHSTIAVAGGKSPNVTTHPYWKKYVAPKCDYEVTSSGWLDLAAIRGMTEGIPLPIESQDGNPPVLVGDVIKLLGLETLNAVVGQSGYKGKALWGETWVEAPAPRTGLLSLSDDTTITLKDLPPLPEGATTFMASRLDVSKTYDVLLHIARNGVKLIPEADAEEQFESAIGEIKEKLGFDLKQELVAAAGGVVVGWNDSRQGILSMGSGFALQLKDAKKISTGLHKLADVVERESDGQVRFRRSEKHGREMLMLEFGPSPFGQTFCVDKNWLVMGSPQVVEAFLLRVDGKLAKWSPNEEYKTSLATMPERFSSIAVSSPRGMVNLVMGLVPLGVGLAQVGIEASGAFPEGFEFPLHIEDIPAAELISAPLFPNVMTGEVTADGFHSTSRASLPTIPLVGSDAATTTAVVAVGVALLLPAVQAAKAAATRVESQNNIRQVGLGAFSHEAVHRSFPAGTVENDDLEPEERLSWMVPLLPFLEQNNVYGQIDRKQGWKADANARPLAAEIPTFLNPTVQDDFRIPVGDFDDSAYGRTHYVGMAGVGEDAAKLDADDPKAGIFGYNRKTRFADVTDGLSNTIMTSEAAGTYGPWGAGGFSTIRSLVDQPYINGTNGIGSPNPEGCNMGFADGSTRFISANIDPSVLEALVTKSGGEAVQAP